MLFAYVFMCSLHFPVLSVSVVNSTWRWGLCLVHCCIPVLSTDPGTYLLLNKSLLNKRMKEERDENLDSVKQQPLCYLSWEKGKQGTLVKEPNLLQFKANSTQRLSDTGTGPDSVETPPSCMTGREWCRAQTGWGLVSPRHRTFSGLRSPMRQKGLHACLLPGGESLGSGCAQG